MKFSSPSYAGVLQGCAHFKLMNGLNENNINGGIVYRGKKLLAPGRALLPALGCLAFLLMASCMSQLPNAFPQCGNRMYSVFPSREFARAVFLYYYKGSPLLDLWQKRGGVSRAGMFSI